MAAGAGAHQSSNCCQANSPLLGIKRIGKVDADIFATTSKRARDDGPSSSFSAQGGPPQDKEGSSSSQRAARQKSTFVCPIPGCNRRYAELWKLRQHVRAPKRPAKGQGGHETELTHCPKCNVQLHPGQAHLGCAAGLSAPRQAVKRRKMQQQRELRRTGSWEPVASAIMASPPLARAESEAVLPPAAGSTTASPERPSPMSTAPSGTVSPQQPSPPPQPPAALPAGSNSQAPSPVAAAAAAGAAAAAAAPTNNVIQQMVQAFVQAILQPKVAEPADSGNCIGSPRHSGTSGDHTSQAAPLQPPQQHCCSSSGHCCDGGQVAHNHNEMAQQQPTLQPQFSRPSLPSPVPNSLWGACGTNTNTNTGAGATTNGFTAASTPFTVPRGWTPSPRPGSALLPPLSFTPLHHGQPGQHATCGPNSAAWLGAPMNGWEQQFLAARTPPLPPPTSTMPSSLPAPSAANFATLPPPPSHATPASSFASQLSLAPGPSPLAAGPQSAPPALSLGPEASGQAQWERQPSWGGRAAPGSQSQAPAAGGRLGKCDSALPDEALLLGNGFGGSCAGDMLLEMLGDRLNDNEAWFEASLTPPPLPLMPLV